MVSWLEFNSAFNTIQAQTESSDCSLGCSVTLVWRGVQCGWWVCMFVCLFVCVSERTVNLVLSKTAFNSAAMIRARHLTCPGWYVCSLSSSTGSANDANPNPNPWCQTPDVSRLVRLFSFILHWQHKRRYLVYSEIGLGFLPPPPTQATHSTYQCCVFNWSVLLKRFRSYGGFTSRVHFAKDFQRCLKLVASTVRL